MAEEDPPRRKKRRHAPEVKAEAVRRALEGEHVTRIAADMGIDHRTVWVWVNAAKNAAIDPAGDLTPEAIARVRQLERENAMLRRDLEFAKKWAALSREISRDENGSR